jgi:hypothetical protein
MDHTHSHSSFIYFILLFQSHTHTLEQVELQHSSKKENRKKIKKETQNEKIHYKKTRFSDTCNVGALIKRPYKGTF